MPVEEFKGFLLYTVELLTGYGHFDVEPPVFKAVGGSEVAELVKYGHSYAGFVDEIVFLDAGWGVRVVEGYIPAGDVVVAVD